METWWARSCWVLGRATSRKYLNSHNTCCVNQCAYLSRSYDYPYKQDHNTIMWSRHDSDNSDVLGDYKEHINGSPKGTYLHNGRLPIVSLIQQLLIAYARVQPNEHPIKGDPANWVSLYSLYHSTSCFPSLKRAKICITGAEGRFAHHSRDIITTTQPKCVLLTKLPITERTRTIGSWLHLDLEIYYNLEVPEIPRGQHVQVSQLKHR